MAINTYVALDKITVGTNTNTITLGSIPSGYTDLRLVVNAKTSDGSGYFQIFPNNNTSSVYSRTYFFGNTSGGGSNRSTSNANGIQLNCATSSHDINSAPLTLDFMNYSDTSMFKTVLIRSGSVSYALVEAWAFLFSSTSAISSLVFKANTANFVAGSTFELYGIKAWANTETSPKATGGYVYSDSSYWYHAFPFSSTFTPNQSLTADILQIAGGGGGGQDSGGGGGAGGLLYFASQSLSATGYAVTVGAGGKGSVSYAGKTNGVNSQFASLTASVGGGQGGGYGAYNPSTGGSGGGASGGGGSATGASGTSGQGNSGGNSFTNGGIYPGGGGGGAGGAGLSPAANTSPAGAGGIGVSTYSSWGIATQTGHNVSGTIYYAGGGGGSTTIPGAGGLGGGGNGTGDGSGTYFPAFSQHGLVNTGGGGGGGANLTGATAGGNGGSGLVIVRYAK